LYQTKPNHISNADVIDSSWNSLFKIGGMAAIIAGLCFIVTMFLVFILGAEPITAEEYFEILNNNRIVGLLRLDFTSVIGVTLYYPMFISLYGILKRYNSAYAHLAVSLAFAGITLWLATHSALSMVYLSDNYAAALTEAQKSRLLAAGEAVIASDMYKSTGALVSGILLEGSAVIFSFLMLRCGMFGKLTAYAGIAGNGLDLARIIFNIFLPGMANVVMTIAGPLMVIWIILLGRRLFLLGSKIPLRE
jgi:hypothetical protein